MTDRTDTLDTLRRERPEVAIVTEWEYDPDAVWDGDGPEPEGMSPCVVTVKAVTVVNGNLVEGFAYLGGVWEDPTEVHDQEIGGYFPQMAEDAIAELDENLAALED